jgi:RNA polymerase sigma-70 factor (ECF subfamily)
MLETHDQELVESCRKGDRAALAVLITRYQRPLFNAAYRVLGNTEDACDVTQAVFLKVAERLDDYDPRSKFFSWIYRITLNEAIDVLRRNRRQEPLEDETVLPAAENSNPEACYYHGEIAERIQRALMRLKVDDRALLTLKHFSGCSYREIGEILQLEEKTVKSRLFEARQRLSALLQDLKTT